MGQLAEPGILGLGFDDEAGGELEVMVVLTETGQHLGPEPVLSAALTPGSLIAELGSAEQRQLLDEVAAGRHCGVRPRCARQALRSKVICGR